MKSTASLMLAAGALLFAANPEGVATAADVVLHEPTVLPVVYDGLTRWCGPDVLIGNTEAGQRLYHLDQIGQDGGLAGDTIDPVLLESEVSSSEFIGCHVSGSSDLTYWKLRDPFWAPVSWLMVNRLHGSGTTPPIEFRREEHISLPSGFRTWSHRELAIFVSYFRSCGQSRQTAPEDKAPGCIGIERIDLATFERARVMERESLTSAKDGAHDPDVAMVTGSGRLSALIVEGENTFDCTIEETALGTTCRLASRERLVRPFDDLPRRIFVDSTGVEVVLVSGKVLVCQPWSDTAAPADQPQCRSVALNAGPSVKRLRLEAILPDGRAIVNADQCLSLARVSLETGAVTDLTCLMEPIKSAVPAEIRDTLVPSEAFKEERDGITIPDWAVRLSPTGKWLAIQVPKAECGARGPTPETMLSRVNIESCGQLMIWPADRFVR